jgi:hypothetical protein
MGILLLAVLALRELVGQTKLVATGASHFFREYLYLEDKPGKKR